jgi:hypothetical protein
MPIEEVTVALAVHCQLHGFSAKSASRQLDPTPRDHFEAARAWAESNAKVIELIESDPEVVIEGGYTLSEGRSWFSRLFGIGRAKAPALPTADQLEHVAAEVATTSSRQRRSEDPERARRLAALRALVDESLD